jgi:hypothetical protein
VLGSDEHAYHRILIDREVPVGDLATDDRNQNGRLDWPAERCSPLADLRHATWYVTSGGAGAPYYSEERTPWNTYGRTMKGGEVFFRYSSQENIVIFRTDSRRLGMRVLNPHGELIDEVADLMAVKR